MELKNAIAICLISMFSATLVLLVARALDMQAAARIEPQLARIVEELEAIRKQGGVAPATSATQAQPALNDGLIVYYFHSNVRCVTCRAIESQSHDVVQTKFAGERADGRLVWKTLNYEEADGKGLGRQFEIQVPVVVLAEMHDGQLGRWNRLDRVWALVNDQESFAQYVETEIRTLLTDAAVTPDMPAAAPDIPLPADGAGSNLPIPEDTSLIPVPE